ncbi:hypothetical protein LUZ60_015318 [Juncus effusus]|nr:hypothetical protein LUZ60_015318 [Juncus effusus]
MKRPMTQKDDEEQPTENFLVANTLMLLSRSNHGQKTRVFECKTCNRQFPSFQALGGHRASHKKPRHVGSEGVNVAAEPSKPRVHECSICGLEFSIGQALGGHMRRHRANGEAKRVDPLLKSRLNLNLNLDLNLAPPEVDELELRLVEKVRFVDWLH